MAKKGKNKKPARGAFKKKLKKTPKQKFFGVNHEKLYTALIRFSSPKEKPTLEELRDDFEITKTKNPKKSAKKKTLNKKAKNKNKGK